MDQLWILKSLPTWLHFGLRSTEGLGVNGGPEMKATRKGEEVQSVVVTHAEESVTRVLCSKGWGMAVGDNKIPSLPPPGV